MLRDRRAELARKNLDQRLGPLRDLPLQRPRGGWIRAIRDALGMSSRQLARRLDVAQSRIIALEQAEAAGTTTLKSLREAAEALQCRVVYALVPIKPLNDIVRDRAKSKAYDQHLAVAHGMLLENQSLTVKQTEEELDRLSDEILAEPIRFLWEDE